MNKNRPFRFTRSLALLLALAGSAGELHAQTVTAGYGAPLTPINIANGPATFNVQIVGGSSECAGSSNFTVTLPVGFTYVSGSAAITSGSATLSETSASGGTAALVISNIPTGNTEFSFQALPGCELIGTTATLEAAYTLDGCAGMMTASSNPFNVQNAQLNITGITNASYGGAIGSVFTREITVSNDGYGTIDTIYLDDLIGSGFEIENVTVSAGTIVTTTTTETGGTRHRYRIVNTMAAGSSVVVTETVRLGCGGTEYLSAFQAWYGPAGVSCSGIGDIATAGASASAAAVAPVLDVWTTTGSTFQCAPVTAYDTVHVKNTGTIDMTNLRLYTNVEESCNEFPGSLRINSGWRRNIWMDTTAMPLRQSMDGGATWVAPSYDVLSIFNTLGSDPADGQLLGVSLNVDTLAVGEEFLFLVPRHLAYDKDCANGAWLGRTLVGYSTFSYNNGCAASTGAIDCRGGKDGYYPINDVGTSPNLASIDVVAGVDFPIDFNISGAVRYNPSTVANDGYLEFVVDLPGCIVPKSLDIADFALMTAAGTTPPEMGTPYYDTDGKIRIPFSLVDPTAWIQYTVNATKLHINSVMTDCSACTDGTAITVSTILKQSTTCSDEFVVHCVSTPPLNLHNCDPGTCSGIANTFGEAKRTSVGLADENNDGIADGTSLANANTRLFTNSDTVKVSANGYFLSTYDYAYFSNKPNVSWMAPLSGEVSIYDASAATTYTVTGLPVTGTYPEYMVNLSVAGLSGLPGGFHYEAGDSVKASILYKTNNFHTPGIGSATVQWKNGLFASETEGGAYIGCDTPFTPLAYYVYRAKDVYTYTSPTVNCGGFTDWTLRNYNIVGGTLAPNAIFPYEVRRFSYPQYYGYVVPEGYVSSGARFVNYGYTGHTDKTVADSVSGDTMFYRIPEYVSALRGGSANYYDEGFDYRMHPILSPKCDITPGNKTVYQVFITKEIENDWRDTAYYVPTTLINGYDANQIQLIPVNANITANTNTVEWEVLIKNTGSSVNKVWIGKDAGISGVTITGVDWISAPGGTVSGVGIESGGVYHISGGFPGGGNYYYRIKATYTGCLSDTLPLAYGFNCSGDFPATVADATCKKSLKLSVTPRSAALQLSIVDQPTTAPGDLCSTLDYELEVNNVGQGEAGHPYVNVRWPSAGGLGYVAGSYEIEYPIGSGYVPVSDDSVTTSGINLTLRSTVAQLAGTDKFRIRFQAVSIPCDIVSGSYIKFRSVGVNPCGSTIASTMNNSNPINLTGAPDAINSYTLRSSAAVVTGCVDGGNVNSAYRFTIINNGPDVSGPTDGFNITLPAPWTMDGSAVTWEHNPGGASFTSSAGSVYKFKIGAVAAGDSVVITTNLAAASSALACGASEDPISEVATAEFTTTCATDPTVSCTTQQILFSNETTFINVNRPAYTLSSLTAEQSVSCPTCMSGSVTLNHTAGSTYEAQNIDISFYQDVDNSGTYTVGDLLLGNQTYAIDNLASQTYNFDVNTGISGSVSPVIAVGDIPCVCATPQTVFADEVVLPIRFTKHTVQVEENCKVVLVWAYEANDVSVTSFEILRSQDGKSFTKIAGLPATAQQYNDYAPGSGNWIYRIVATGSDGSRVNSPVLYAATASCTNAGLSVYPNPAKDDAEVLLQSNNPLTAGYVLTDVTGRVVLKGNLEANVKMKMNFDGLASGVYTLRVVQNGESYIEKVTIKK